MAKQGDARGPAAPLAEDVGAEGEAVSPGVAAQGRNGPGATGARTRRARRGLRSADLPALQRTQIASRPGRHLQGPDSRAWLARWLDSAGGIGPSSPSDRIRWSSTVDRRVIPSSALQGQGRCGRIVGEHERRLPPWAAAACSSMAFIAAPYGETRARPSESGRPPGRKPGLHRREPGSGCCRSRSLADPRSVPTGRGQRLQGRPAAFAWLATVGASAASPRLRLTATASVEPGGAGRRHPPPLELSADAAGQGVEPLFLPGGMARPRPPPDRTPSIRRAGDAGSRRLRSQPRRRPWLRTHSCVPAAIRDFGVGARPLVGDAVGRSPSSWRSGSARRRPAVAAAIAGLARPDRWPVEKNTRHDRCSSRASRPERGPGRLAERRRSRRSDRDAVVVR